MKARYIILPAFGVGLIFMSRLLRILHWPGYYVTVGLGSLLVISGGILLFVRLKRDRD